MLYFDIGFGRSENAGKVSDTASHQLLQGG
jgi:hypothetical protein